MKASAHRAMLAWLAACCAGLPLAVGAAPLAAPVLPGVAGTAEAPGAIAKATRARAKAVTPKATWSAEAAPQPAQAPAPDSWEIVIADRTLHAALARWAATAGWQLLWEMPVDYAVQARTTIPGKFEDAVTVVVTSMENAEIPMMAVFYQGNKVLRVMAKGAQ